MRQDIGWNGTLEQDSSTSLRPEMWQVEKHAELWGSLLVFTFFVLRHKNCTTSKFPWQLVNMSIFHSVWIPPFDRFFCIWKQQWLPKLPYLKHCSKFPWQARHFWKAYAYSFSLKHRTMKQNKFLCDQLSLADGSCSLVSELPALRVLSLSSVWLADDNNVISKLRLSLGRSSSLAFSTRKRASSMFIPQIFHSNCTCRKGDNCFAQLPTLFSSESRMSTCSFLLHFRMLWPRHD